MALELRVLTADDWALWRRLRQAALADAPDMFGATLAEWSGDGDREERWRDRLSIPGAHDLLAVLDGEAVGMVSGVPNETDPRVAIMISMWVSPAARGRGIGEVLVGALIGWATGAGYVTLTLDVRAHNAAAIALYERMGFRLSATDDAAACERSYSLDLAATR